MSTSTPDAAQMMTRQGKWLSDLEGRHVNVALIDGSLLDDVTLVSSGRGLTPTLWLDVAGIDMFVARVRVADVWEPPARRAA